MEERVKQLEAEIEQIKQRNKRVEADKAWETSKTRTAFVAIITFVLIYLFMRLIHAEQPLLNAFVSVAAYWLSTESYGILKKWWLQKKSS